MASTTPFHKRVLRWGDSFGIQLTRKDLEHLGIREDDEVDVSLKAYRPEVDWDALPRLSLGRDASRRHDEILREGMAVETS